MSLNNVLGSLIKKERGNRFDLSKSLSENIFPYTNQSLVHQLETGEEVPIAVNESEWETIDYNGQLQLYRSFVLQSTRHLMYFLAEIVKKSDQIDHHPIITIDHLSVDILLYTKEINDITSLDLDMSKYIGELYEDVKFIRSF